MSKPFAWKSGSICQTTGNQFVALIRDDMDNEAGNEISQTFDSSLEALDWLFDKAKDRHVALSLSFAWREPSPEA